jgi:uncharacterized protein YjdB
MIYYIYQNDTKVQEVTDVKTATITGLAANTSYTFAVSAWNGKKESAKSNVVTVKTSTIPVTNITISITDYMETGQSVKAVVSLTPNNTTDTVTYTSSDTSIATVAGDGTVKALRTGSVTITATTTSGKTATATIGIYEPMVTVTNLAASNTTASGTTLTWQ